MKGYKIKFADYRPISKDIATEKETLEYIIEIDLDNRPSVEDRKHLIDAESWAAYAYMNNKPYYLTFFKDEKAVASVSVDELSITVYYLDSQNDKYINYLRIIFFKYDFNKYMDDILEEYPDGKMFLHQIDINTDTDLKSFSKQMLFNHEKRLLTYNESVFSKTENIYSKQSKEAKVNTSSNFLRKPQSYKDYEYLLDYKNLLKAEYLDL